MVDSRTAAFLSTADNATPMTAGALVLLALVGIWLLRRLRFSVNASI